MSLTAACPQGVPLQGEDAERVVAFDDLHISLYVSETEGASLQTQRLVQVAFNDRGEGRAKIEELHATIDGLLEAMLLPYRLIPLDDPPLGGVRLGDGVHVYADVDGVTQELEPQTFEAVTAYLANFASVSGATRLRIEDHGGGAPWTLWEAELPAVAPFDIHHPQPQQELDVDEAVEVSFSESPLTSFVQVRPADADAPCIEALSDNVREASVVLGPVTPTEAWSGACDTLLYVTQYQQPDRSSTEGAEALQVRTQAVAFSLVEPALDGG